MQLTKQQKIAFDKFSKLKVGALFMEMGTGKTLTALELINFNKDKVDLIIWFTPCSTIDNLQVEIDKWNYDLDILIMGWETLGSSDRKYLELLELVRNKKTFIVADESIFIKNNETNRFKRLIEVAKTSNYRLILNGTPITKNEWDLYYQMEFLSPKIIGMNENQFKNTFYKKIRYKKKGKKIKEFFTLSEINIDYLHKLIDPYVLNVDFNFDKKEKKEVILIKSSNDTLINYEEYKYNILNNLHLMSSDSIMGLLQKLSLISSIDTNKAKAIANFAKGKQVIIFCNYIKEVNLIKKHLNYSYVINGSTKNRNQVLEDFKNNDVPLIMTIGTGAYGLNLQFCNHIIFSSLTFDYSKILQAKARIRRIGQKQDIKYTFFDTELPITKFIGNNIDKKEKLSNLLIKELKNGKSL